MVSDEFHTPAALPREKNPVSVEYEAGWASEPVWTVLKSLLPLPGFEPQTVPPTASPIPTTLSLLRLIIV